MKQRILYLLAAVLMGCSLTLTTSCTSKERQLDSAIKALNRQFPQPVGDGVVLEGFFTTEADPTNIDIAVTLDENKQVEAVTQERMEQMKSDFVAILTQVAHQDKNVHELFQLIADNQKTVSLSVTLTPSKKRHTARFSAHDIQQILAAHDKSSKEMALVQLDKTLQSESKNLPVQMGPLTCKSIERKDSVITWTFEKADSLFDFDRMMSEPEAAKANVMNAQKDPGNLNFNRLILDADCSICYHYIDPATGKTFDINITQQDLRNVQRDAVSTKIEK